MERPRRQAPGLQVGISCVIGLHVEHFAIAGVPLEDAVAAAVDVALTPVDLVGRSLLSGGGHGLLPGSGARLGCASEECGTRGSGGSQARERAFDEGAARQGGLGFSHSPSSS